MLPAIDPDMRRLIIYDLAIFVLTLMIRKKSVK